MADDELDEDFDPEAIEEDIDEETIDEVVLDDDLADDDVLVDADALVETDDVVDDDEEEVVVEETAAARKKRKDEEDEDEEELDPDDVEADLDTILKDRIAAVEDEDDDEELEAAPRATVEAPDGVIPKRANEFTCTGCFLLVNRGQFGPEGRMQCPVGESDCPAIEQLQQSGAPKVKPAKATGRKR